MGGVEIALLILQNAPSIISTAEEAFEWGAKTYKAVVAAYDLPADQITKEMLLAKLADIQANSDEIQAID